MGYEIAIENSKPLKFRTAQFLLSWCQKELDYWGWINDVNAQDWANYSGRLNTTIQSLSTVISSPENQGYQNGLEGELHALQLAIKNNQYIYSKSSLAEFISQEKEISKDFAAKILHIATRSNEDRLPANKIYLLAASALFDFQRGITKRAATVSVNAINGARVELEALAKEQAINTEIRIEKLDALIASREQKIEASTKAMASTLGKHKSITRQEQQELRQQTKDDTDQLIRDLTDTTTIIKETYESKMALQAPIQYWKDKAVSHKHATYWFAALFVGYSGFTLWLLISFIQNYGNGLQGFIASWKDAGVGAVASFAGLIGLGMVIARVLYRLFASQLHLWNDARERVVMIQTYLSLAQQGHAKEEFLGALLQRLFSPSADGIVKSDLGAVGIGDGILKLLGNR